MKKLKEEWSEPLSEQERTTLWVFVRHVSYFFALLLCICGMWKLGKADGAACVGEDGIIEVIEAWLLLFTGCVYTVLALCSRPYRALLFWLASLLFAATCRELDFYFDLVLPVISWKFCYVFPFAALIYLWRHRVGVRRELFLFLRSHTFYLLFTASLVVLVIAQAVAHRSFIEDVLGTDLDLSLTRRLMEEPIELVGYIIILFSTWEFYWELIVPAMRQARELAAKEDEED